MNGILNRKQRRLKLSFKKDPQVRKSIEPDPLLVDTMLRQLEQLERRTGKSARAQESIPLNTKHYATMPEAFVQRAWKGQLS